MVWHISARNFYSISISDVIFPISDFNMKDVAGMYTKVLKLITLIIYEMTKKYV